jgi:hypothetical protein
LFQPKTAEVAETPTYIPISPDPGILSRLSVDYSGGSRKSAQEQSDRDDINRRIAADCLMWILFGAEYFVGFAIDRSG